MPQFLFCLPNLAVVQPTVNQITEFKCFIKIALTSELNSGESGGQKLIFKCKLLASQLMDRK